MVRTVLRNDFGPVYVKRLRQERENFIKKLWEKKNKEQRRAYWRAKRQEPVYKAYEKERKRKWREANRDRYNAYQRRYYELNPARQEYVKAKGQEYRAAHKN